MFSTLQTLYETIWQYFYATQIVLTSMEISIFFINLIFLLSKFIVKILPYFSKFWKSLKVSFLGKNCILKTSVWDSITERLTLVYWGIYSYWTKVSFPGNQAWNPETKHSKFLNFENNNFKPS